MLHVKNTINLFASERQLYCIFAIDRHDKGCEDI